MALFYSLAGHLDRSGVAASMSALGQKRTSRHNIRRLAERCGLVSVLDGGHHGRADECLLSGDCGTGGNSTSIEVMGSLASCISAMYRVTLSGWRDGSVAVTDRVPLSALGQGRTFSDI